VLAGTWHGVCGEFRGCPRAAGAEQWLSGAGRGGGRSGPAAGAHRADARQGGRQQPGHGPAAAPPAPHGRRRPAWCAPRPTPLSLCLRVGYRDGAMDPQRPHLLLTGGADPLGARRARRAALGGSILTDASWAADGPLSHWDPVLADSASRRVLPVCVSVAQLFLPEHCRACSAGPLWPPPPGEGEPRPERAATCRQSAWPCWHRLAGHGIPARQHSPCLRLAPPSARAHRTARPRQCACTTGAWRAAPAAARRPPGARRWWPATCPRTSRPRCCTRGPLGTPGAARLAHPRPLGACAGCALRPAVRSLPPG